MIQYMESLSLHIYIIIYIIMYIYKYNYVYIHIYICIHMTYLAETWRVKGGHIDLSNAGM
jgi:hypothetical protein